MTDLTENTQFDNFKILDERDEDGNVIVQLPSSYEVAVATNDNETANERNEYFRKRHADQLEAVDHDMMRENAHSTMAITKPDRQTRVTFGGPRKES